MNLEGRGRGLNEVLAQYLCRGTDGNYENWQISRFPGRVSNRGPPNNSPECYLHTSLFGHGACRLHKQSEGDVVHLRNLTSRYEDVWGEWGYNVTPP
jgi:hypothetical protein